MKQFSEKAGIAGIAGIALAALTIVLYIALDSMFFTPLVVILLLAAICLFIVAVVTGQSLITIPSYLCTFVAMYRFLVLEVDYRMDTIVDTGIGDLDTMFFILVACFILTSVLGIIASVRLVGQQTQKVKA